MTQIIARIISQQGIPHAEPLEFGGSFPWGDSPDKVRVACPDPDNPVVFELRRI